MEKIIGKQPEKIIGGAADAAPARMEEKVSKAIDFIRKVGSIQTNVHVAYSGGKDSEVLLDLFRQSKVSYTAFYNSTTIDPPGTISWVKQHADVTILQPVVSFFKLIERRGLPSFARRFCCAKLKERFVAENVFTGVRAAESQNRAKRYQEPEICFTYRHGRKGHHYMPLLDWTNAELSWYIESRRLQCHPNYYDESGHFCVGRRLGCMGCPLPYDRSIGDFQRYPKLVKAWCRSVAIYRNTRPTLINGVKLFRDEYENFCFNVLCNGMEHFNQQFRGLFPVDARQLLQDLFHVQLPAPQSKLDDIEKRLEVHQTL